MEFKEVVEGRRSIRKYLVDDIEDEKIIELIRIATLSPSGHNRQPWKFQIVRGELKDRIADALIEKGMSLSDASVPHTASIIKDAPVLIVVYLEKENEEHYITDILSIGAAIENMLLAATDMGLGSLWIGNTKYIEEELKEILNTNMKVISTVTLGYKNQDPHARPRKQLAEVIVEK